MVARLSRHRPFQIDKNGLDSLVYPSYYLLWLVVFSNWTYLARTFFWILFSMSNLKLDEWKNLSDSRTQTLRPATNPQVKVVSVTFNISIDLRKYAIDLGYFSEITEKRDAKSKTIKRLFHSSFEDHLTILLKSNRLLKSDSATLVGNSHSVSFILKEVFQNIDKEIIINGHTKPKLQMVGMCNLLCMLSVGWAATAISSPRGAIDKYKIIIDINVFQRRLMVTHINITIYPTIMGGWLIVT